MALNLLPEVNAEDRTWRFIGLQSKNRKEWNLMHIANMFCGGTTVGLYDTLGEEAEMYIINQTEMATVACTQDIVTKIVTWKEHDNQKEEG